MLTVVIVSAKEVAEGDTVGKHAGHRGRVEERRRMVTACFARAPSRRMNDTYVHLLLKFHEVRLVSNTRHSNLVDDDAMSVGSAA